ncbi:MAG: hypothetical protein ACK5MW_00345 [Enterococcus sp.]
MSKSFVWLNRLLIFLIFIALAVIIFLDVFLLLHLELSHNDPWYVWPGLLLENILYFCLLLTFIHNERNKKNLLKLRIWPYLIVAVISFFNALTTIFTTPVNYVTLTIYTSILLVSLGIFGSLFFAKNEKG